MSGGVGPEVEEALPPNRLGGGTCEQGLVLEAGRAGDAQGPDLGVRSTKTRALPGDWAAWVCVWGCVCRFRNVGEAMIREDRAEMEMLRVGRRSRVSALVSSELSAVVYQPDMHFDKETHRETERPRLRFSADRVREREEKRNLWKRIKNDFGGQVLFRMGRKQKLRPTLPVPGILWPL